VWSAAFTRDGQRVVTASEDETAQIWDAASGRRLTPPLKHKFQVHDAHFSPNGRWVVTGSRDKSARVWNAETGEAVTPPLPHESAVAAVRFVADGQAVLTTDRTGQLWRWELASDPRPLEDLEQIAQLLSGHSVDPIGGAIPLPNDELAGLWRKLHAKYPGEFSVTPEAVVAWHELELDRSEADQQWAAARFHLEQLLTLRPDDPRWLERRERLQGQPAAP
jgi:WD40 repeat protein